MRACEVKKWTPNLYQELAARTMPKPNDKLASGLHGALGLVAEYKEYKDALLYEIDFSLPFDFSDEMHIKRELGDMWWMLAEICTANCLELEQVLTAPIDIIVGDGEYTFGMAAASANVCGMYQKTFQGHEIDRTKMCSELSKVAFSLNCLSMQYGGSEEIWSLNIEKLEARYPDGFDTNKSLHRAEGDV